MYNQNEKSDSDDNEKNHHDTGMKYNRNIN